MTLWGLSDDERESSVRGLSKTKSTCRGDGCVAGQRNALHRISVGYCCRLVPLTIAFKPAALLFLLFLRRLWENRATWELIRDKRFLPGTPLSACPVSVTKCMAPAGMILWAQAMIMAELVMRLNISFNLCVQKATQYRRRQVREATTSEIWRRAIGKR
jgi:hypothetical protein